MGIFINAMISGNYLLLALPPYYTDSSGDIWLDELWYRDLVGHLEHIENLIILSEQCDKPLSGKVNGCALIKVDAATRARLKFSRLPSISSSKQIPFHFMRCLPILWRPIQQADIVHSGVIGWPYPLGLIANPIARILKKPLIIVVESSTWRLANPRSASRIARIRESLNEKFATWSVKRADLAVFTSPGYCETLGRPENGALLIAPANWVKTTDILSNEQAKATWAAKTGCLKFICPTRLEANKGISVIIEALEKLDAQKLDIQVDLIGHGALEAPLRKRLSQLRNLKSSLFEPVPYGEPFFNLLQQYDMLIAPTLGDEQPRVIFDGFSQGLGVIASNSPGQDFLVDEGYTGALYWRTSADDLAKTIAQAATDRDWLENLGMNALNYVRVQTHEAMHQRRAEAIMKMLSDKPNR